MAVWKDVIRLYGCLWHRVRSYTLNTAGVLSALTSSYLSEAEAYALSLENMNLLFSFLELGSGCTSSALSQLYQDKGDNSFLCNLRECSKQQVIQLVQDNWQLFCLCNYSSVYGRERGENNLSPLQVKQAGYCRSDFTVLDGQTGAQLIPPRLIFVVVVGELLFEMWHFPCHCLHFLQQFGVHKPNWALRVSVGRSVRLWIKRVLDQC